MTHTCVVLIASSLLTLALEAQPPPTPSRQWQRAANILPGSHILIRERGQRAPQACTLVWIDNSALACDVYVDTGSQRVVYPASSVVSVAEASSVGQEHEGPSVVLPLVLAGAGAILGGLAAKDSGTRAGFVGAMLGAALGGGMGAAIAVGFPAQQRTRWPMRVPFPRWR